MDKILSDEERIKRACEVAERRQNKELNYNRVKLKKTQSKTKVFLIQILVCLIIYSGFYYMKNIPNSEFNNKWIEKTKDVLSYDIDFMELYNQITNNKIEENIDNQNKMSLLRENMFTNKEEKLGIGGEFEGQKDNEIIFDNKDNEMDDDVRYIKDNINLISPVNGVITSRYGEREPSELVSANHKGIDIGAAAGTDIVSACDGKVILVSSDGDFGKHIKIKKGEAIFIYAHCSKLLVNEGDDIKAGQKIAEVGSTGRATGPHLHFEIRRGERVINPELIMNFE